MTDFVESVWPNVELSDSEDETSGQTEVRKVQEDLKPEGITDEDLQGAFPSLKSAEKSDSSSDSENDELNSAEKEKRNPYLSSFNTDAMKQKYNSKLQALHLKRNEARKLNHQEVAAEDQRKKLPANYEARRRKAEWELEDRKARQAAVDAGEDYDNVKILEETAESIEIFDRRKRKKRNQDPGFSDYAASQFRQYERLTDQMKADLDSYQRTKERLGEAVFPSAHNLMYGTEGKVSEANIDRMVNDLEKQIDKRSKYHRRRQHQDEADIDYINEKNMKFNQKAERYYGKYTQEIKQNLERGTAI